MKNVDLNKIKELCAKGAVLLMLTGTITTTTISGPTYTVSAATKTLKSTKSSALKKLLAAYNSYDKDNYYSTQYKSITKYYNAGVTKINNCETKSDVSKILDTYKKKMAKVKDKKTVLAEYKIKMQKSLLENYKDLVENNNYDNNGLKELESIYNTYNTKINKTTTKTKAKKYKNTAISKMENVCTKVIVNADGTKTMSLEQVDKKVKALCKKYPAYTEEEIRTLYVIMNADEFNYDVYEYLNISSKEEMKDKIKIINKIFENYERANLYISYYSRKHDQEKQNEVLKEKTKMINLYDFIENDIVKKHCKELVETIDYGAKYCINYNEYGEKYEVATEYSGLLVLYLYGVVDEKNPIGQYTIYDEYYNTRIDSIIVNKFVCESATCSNVISGLYYSYYPSYVYKKENYNADEEYSYQAVDNLSMFDKMFEDKLYNEKAKSLIKR